MTSDEDVESLSELGLAEAYLRKGNLKESINTQKNLQKSIQTELEVKLFQQQD